MTDAQTIAGMLSLPDVLRSIGAQMRAGRRADCPFCKGASRGTLSFNDRVWKCFRCNRGGDVFTLLQEKHGCDFKAALRDAADLAGVLLAAQGPADRAAMLKRKRDRERLERAAERLEAAERNTGVELAGRLRDLETARRYAGQRLGVLYRGGREQSRAEAERLEAVLGALPDLTRRLVASHAIVAFASVGDRAGFLLKPGKRGPLVNAVLATGYVNDSQNRTVEVQF